MASMMLVGAFSLVTPLRALTLTSSSSSSPSTIRLSSSQSGILGVPLCSPPLHSLSTSFSSSPDAPFVSCGRGDKKTAKGKRFRHSFGNARPRNKKKGRGPPRIPVPAAPPKADDLFEEDEAAKN